MAGAMKETRVTQRRHGFLSAQEIAQGAGYTLETEQAYVLFLASLMCVDRLKSWYVSGHDMACTVGIEQVISFIAPSRIQRPAVCYVMF